MNRHHGLILALVASVIALACGPSGVAEPWSLSVGPAVRGGMQIGVSGSSWAQQCGVHGADPYNIGPGGEGAADAFADRTYDDGFVRIDPGTAVDGLGLTWYWRYENMMQYDGAADTLTYTRSGGSLLMRTTVIDRSLDDEEDDVGGAGIAATATRDLFLSGRLAIGLAAGIQSVWGLESSFGGMTFSERIDTYEYSIVDTYALEGVVPPAAPYEGTFDGPGPLIPNTPTMRSTVTTSAGTWDALNHVDIDVEASVQELWLGSRLEVQAAESLSFHATPFLSLNYLDVDVDREEQFSARYADGRTQTIASWSDSASKDEWLFGAGISAGGRVAVSDNWFVEVDLAYEWVDDMDVTVGPNTVSVDVSGYSATAQVGREF